MVTKQECKERLREVTRELGHHPSAKEWRDGGYNPSLSTIASKFGGWNAAKEAAGLKTMEPGKLRDNFVFIYTDEDGYVRVRHQHDGKRVQFRLHRLAAVAEHGFDEVAGKDVHHESDIPWDNRPENLTPIDHSEHSKITREQSPTA